MLSQWLSPAFADPYFDQGVSSFNKHQYTSAVQYFSTYIAAHPKDPDALYYLGASYQGIGNYDKAKKVYGTLVSEFGFTKAGQYGARALASIDQNYLRSIQGGGAGSATRSSDATANAKLYYSTGGSPNDSLPDQQRLDYQDQGNAMALQAQINNRPLTMMLDTGAEHVVLGKNHLSALGLPMPTGAPAGEARGVGSAEGVPYWIMPVELKVGSMVRRNYPILVQEKLDALPLLGESFFTAYNCTIDRGAHSIRFIKKNMMAQANGYAVPYVEQGRELVVPIEVNGKPFHAYFDTGASGVTFSQEQLKKLGISVPDDAQEGQSMGIGGTTKTFTFNVNSLKMGPIDRRNVPISMSVTSSMDWPLLGQDFYPDWEITIDRTQHVLRLQRR